MDRYFFCGAEARLKVKSEVLREWDCMQIHEQSKELNTAYICFNCIQARQTKKTFHHYDKSLRRASKSFAFPHYPKKYLEMFLIS